MREIALTLGALILFAGTAAAEGPVRHIALYKTVSLPEVTRSSQKISLGHGLTLVAPSRIEKVSPSSEDSRVDELPLLLQERSFSEPDTVAGLELALPNFKPLNFVLAADDLMNPTCGLKLELVW
jgi:hypothetical protein